MNVDTGGGVREFGDDARQQGHTQPVEHVRQAVMDDGQCSGIAEHDLVDAARGRITTIGGLDVAVEHDADARQGSRKLPDDGDGVVLDAHWVSQWVVAGNVSELQPDLVQEAAQGGIERMADEEILAGALLQVGWAEAHREECAAQPVDDLAQGLTGGKLAAARLERALLCHAPLLARKAQVADDLVELPQYRGRCVGRATKWRVH